MDFFKVTSSATRRYGMNGEDARNEQAFMRCREELSEDYGEEYDDALSEYEKEQEIEGLLDTVGADSQDDFLQIVQDAGLESEFEALTNGDFGESEIDEFAQKVERKQKQLALSDLAQSAGKIEDNLRDGSQLAQAIKKADSEEQVRNILLEHCNNNQEVADTVYNYLMSNSKWQESSEDSENMIYAEGNPFKGRNITNLMNLMYTNIGDKYVLNENLLRQFDKLEPDGTTDKDGNPNYSIKSGFYTNFNGDICSLSYDYISLEDNDNGQKYIQLNFEEGDTTRSLKYFANENPQGETIYSIINPPNDDIEETSEDFKKRLTVMQNYTTEISDEVLSKEEINEKYELLAQYDQNIGVSLSQLMSEFQSQGWGDDVRNWFVSLLGTSGIDDNEIMNEVGPATQYTQILMDMQNGKMEEAQAQIDKELDRRLAAADTYRDVYKELKQYYQNDELVLKIMNSSAVSSDYAEISLDKNNELCITLQNGDIYKDLDLYSNNSINLEKIKETNIDGIDKSLTKEEMYSFLTYGGKFDTFEDYQQKSEAFTDYNAAIAYGPMLQECKTPEDAFKLLTGKDITKEAQRATITEEDIKLFNDIYGSTTPISTFNEWIKDENGDFLYNTDHYYTLSIAVNKDKNGFDIIYQPYQESLLDGLVPNGEPLNYIPDYSETNDGTNIFQQITKNPSFGGTNEKVEALQKQKFEEFYNQNKEQINEYIKEYAEAQGLNADDIINNPDKLYSESCNYMQYAYMNAKQNFQGNSRFENMTNQYCMEMAQYSSNISHVLSMGCMAASVVFPAAAPLLMTGAKIAGYIDNGIDLLNMLSNKQNYKDDDYQGWATSLGYEIATKAGYRYFSNVAGDLSQASLEKVIDNNIFGLGKLLDNNAVAQMIYRGTSEALIETGICIPYTMALNYTQGGEYDFLKELQENFIYDFMPYARGWQDVLIKGNDPNFKVISKSDENGRYYSAGENGGKIYYDENNRPTRVIDANGNTIREYDNYKANNEYDIIETDENGQKQVKHVKPNGDGTIRIENDNGKIIQNTEKTKDGFVTTYYDEKGNAKFIQTTDKKGHVISTEQNGIKTEYNLSGRPKSATVQTSDGTVEVKYSTVFGTTTMKIGDSSYELSKDGTVDINGYKFSQDMVLQSVKAGVKPEELADRCDSDMSGKITQTDDVSCTVASALNSMEDNFNTAQDFANKFALVGVDENGNRIYKAPVEIFGENATITVGDDSNLFVEAYKIYQAEAGMDLENGGKVSDVFNMMMPDANKVLAQPNIDNIKSLMQIAESGNSALVFSTSNSGLKGFDENGNPVELSADHAYSVRGFDDDGKMILSDPTDPNKTIKVDPDEYMDKEGAQIVGATYDSTEEKLYDGNLAENTVSGTGEKINIDALYSEKMGERQLAEADEQKIKSLLSGCSNPESAADKLKNMSEEDLQKFLALEGIADKLKNKKLEDVQRLLLSCENPIEVLNELSKMDKINQFEKPEIIIKNAVLLMRENIDIDGNSIEDIAIRLANKGLDLEKTIQGCSEKEAKKLPYIFRSFAILSGTDKMNLDCSEIIGITEKLLKIDNKLLDDTIKQIGELLTRLKSPFNGKSLEDLINPSEDSDIVLNIKSDEIGNELTTCGIPSKIKGELQDYFAKDLKLKYSDAIWNSLTEKQKDFCNSLDWGKDGKQIIIHYFGKRIEDPERYKLIQENFSKMGIDIDIDNTVHGELEERLKSFNDGINAIKTKADSILEATDVKKESYPDKYGVNITKATTNDNPPMYVYKKSYKDSKGNTRVFYFITNEDGQKPNGTAICITNGKIDTCTFYRLAQFEKTRDNNY